MKNTPLLLRVFFILLAIGILGILWQVYKKNTIEIKAVGGSLREGIIGTPRFINPVLAQSQADLDLTRLLFTPLLTIDRDKNVSYKLAESVDVSEDNNVYTLTLKDNLFFSDGSQLDADDVIFTIKSIQDQLIKSPLNTEWQGVNPEKVDRFTITFTLAKPFADFIYNLQIGILPEHIWESIDAQEFIFSKYNSQPIGIGPYTVRDIIFADNGIPNEYVLSRNTNNIEQVYIDNLNILFFENEALLLKSILNNSIDSAFGISAQNIENIENKENKEIYSQSLPRVFALFFNQKKQPILASKKIREAITLGINKDNITSVIFNNLAVPINSIYTKDAEESSYDPTEAENIIALEGWKKNDEGIYEKKINGKEANLEFSIAIPNIEDMKLVAESIQSDLKNIGINVVIRSYDQGNLNQSAIRPRDYDALLFGYEIKKPSDIYAFWHSSQISDPGLNVSLFKNTEIDSMLTNLRTNGNADISEINKKIIRDYPAVFLYAPSYTYTLPKSVSGISLSIHKPSDRFNNIQEWYIRTRRIWPIFIKE